MHAGVQHLPAERARHAKRLGHAQRRSQPKPPVIAAGAGTTGLGTTTTPSQQSATSTSTASSQTPPTSTSTNQSLSSALPSSPTQSSSSASSSATTPSATAISSTTQPLPVTTPSSSLVTTPTTLSLTSTASSSTSIPQANVSSATNRGLSGGAIAGIIAGAAVVGAVFIVFIIRKTYLRRRERQRISWNGAPGLDEPKPVPDASESSASVASPANTTQRTVPLSPFETFSQTMYSTPVPPVAHMHPSAIPAYGVPAPPPASYNNPGPVAAYPAHPVPLTYHSGGTTPLAIPPAGISPALSAVRTQQAPAEAIVKCTFVPSLPDELSITTGERVFIVEQYDDGWDLCMNGRGERGMVPRECLARALSDQADIGWRNVKRMSSLISDGRRY